MKICKNCEHYKKYVVYDKGEWYAHKCTQNKLWLICAICKSKTLQKTLYFLKSMW